jgi:ribosomal protein S16
VAFSADGRSVFGWDANDKILVWTVKDGQPTDAANPPPRPNGEQITSPDGSLRAEVVYNGIALIELANYDPLRDYRERLVLEKTNAVHWHQQQAVQAETANNWFAAAFHFNQLLKDKPDDADLKRRRDNARDRITKADGSNAPRFMDKLPPP